ncbi:WD domain-containing protein [Aspergillus affinis]|uniref:WD domain-containing protein n=1 Tax=Aspergillus affinis TaxID=1070780 RepID=UPI0022FE4C19|nr:WD domain-containing protein [Aspergillus affinis]KAI9035063.1 WD domain-containing protein [Aspergillus affinis]
MLFHLSFRDFLVDKTRCTDETLFIDEQQANKKLFNLCMDILPRVLQRNICKFPHPAATPCELSHETIDKQLPQAVQYACQYWGEQNCSTKSVQPNEASKLLAFFKGSFLHWLEALSLARKMAHAIPTLTNPETHTTDVNDSELYYYIVNARRFVIHHNITN